MIFRQVSMQFFLLKHAIIIRFELTTILTDNISTYQIILTSKHNNPTTKDQYSTPDGFGCQCADLEVSSTKLCEVEVIDTIHPLIADLCASKNYIYIEHFTHNICPVQCQNIRMGQRKNAAKEIEKVIKETGIAKKSITELDLTGIKIGKITSEIKKIFEELKGLQTLTLAQCDLMSLDNLPQLPSLIELDVSSNNLKDNDLKNINKYNKLTRLSVADNKILKIQSLGIFKQLANLNSIESADNPIETETNYRKKIFQLLPKIKVLDNQDINGKQVDAEQNQDDDGEFEQDDGEQGGEQGGEGGLEDDDDDQDEEEYDEGDEEDDQQEQEEEEKPKKKKR